jgi:hypothetical protein
VDALHSCGGAGLHVHLPTSSFPPLPPVKIPASQKQTKKTKIPVNLVGIRQISIFTSRGHCNAMPWEVGISRLRENPPQALYPLLRKRLSAS